MKPSWLISLLVLAGAFAALAVLTYSVAFGPLRNSAIELAFTVRDNQFTDHELAGAKTLAEAQHELDSGHAEIITANAQQWEANNGALLVFGVIVLFSLFVLAKKG